MAYNYVLEAKQISINDDTQLITQLLEECLIKNAIDLSLVEKEAQEKKGMWYAFVAKVETATGTSLNATVKVLPQIDINLDSFAHSLLDEFSVYMTELLLNNGVSAENITKSEITGKYVLIKEVLIRLLSFALSKKIGVSSDGQKLLNVTEQFIQKLNTSNVMFNKNVFGNTSSSTFGVCLVNNFDYWLNLMSNSVKASDIIHKNDNAIGGCFELLKKLKNICLRQIILFLNKDLKNQAEYHDDFLALNFKKLLTDYQLQNISSFLNEASKVNNIEELIHNQLITINHLNSKSSNKVNHLERVKTLFGFLIELNCLERVCGQMSILTSALGWFPRITGILNYEPFTNRLEELFTKSKTILRVNLEELPEHEKQMLIQYNSYSCPTNLETNFTAVAKNLKDLSNDEIIQKLFSILGYTVDNLISLQDTLGIAIIDKKRLQQLLKSDRISLNHNHTIATTNTKTLTSISLPSSAATTANNTSNTSSSMTSSANLTENHFNSQKPNKAAFFSDTFNLQSTYIFNDHTINCSIQLNDTPKSNNCYVFCKSTTTWTLKFYLTTDANPTLLAIHEIPDLEHAIKKNDGKQVVETIAAYHMHLTILKLFQEKKYLEVLNYIDAKIERIKQIPWLNEAAELCKSESCCELFKESQTNLRISSNTETSGRKQEMEKKINAYKQNQNEPNDSSNCTIS